MYGILSFGSIPSGPTTHESTGIVRCIKTGNSSQERRCASPAYRFGLHIQWEGHHMSDNWGFDENGNAVDLGNSNEANGPKALRDYAKKLQEQNEDLNRKLTSFLEEQAASKMATVFESLGVPGAQAAYQGPNDPAKAKEWVDSMRSVFGGGQPQQAAVPVTPTLPPSMQAQYERMSQAGQDGAPVGNVEAAQAAVNDANDIQGLINSFKNLGA